MESDAIKTKAVSKSDHMAKRDARRLQKCERGFEAAYQYIQGLIETTLETIPEYL